MNIPLSDVNKNTQELFAFAGERRANISSSHQPAVIAAIQDAIRSEYGDKSFDTAFHLSVWSSDAAFLVALHLWPERFTAEEIREGILAALVHAPNHLAAAALIGFPVMDAFGTAFKSQLTPTKQPPPTRLTNPLSAT